MAGAFARQFLGATLVWRGLLDAGSAALEQAVTYWDRAGVPGPVAARPVGASWALLALVHALRGNDTESTHCIERGRDVIADDDGIVVVPRMAAEDVLRKSEARERKEDQTRARLQAGELGLDIYGMREKLAEKGLAYRRMAAES